MTTPNSSSADTCDHHLDASVHSGTARAWAAALAGRGCPRRARRIVRLAALGACDPERVRDALAPLLDRPDPVTADAVIDRLEIRLGRRGGLASPARTERVGQRLVALGARLLVSGDHAYPARLANAWPELGAPLWIFVRAVERALPDGPAVAIVGTRHPTLDGQRTARALARGLAERGLVVVSGMARGIDQAAHRGALDVGGRTVAVLGTGFDSDYPAGDRALRDEVAANGGLVTELPPDAGPRPRHFLWRNRIISGLADSTVVVEGQARSGSLQTARLAAAQGRDVWAVPGAIHAPTNQGPLALIRDGAHVLTRLEDLLDTLTDRPQLATGDGADPAAPPDLDPPDLDSDAAAVLGMLGAVPATTGALATAVDLPVGRVAAAVATLVDRGLAAATPRGAVAILIH